MMRKIILSYDLIVLIFISNVEQVILWKSFAFNIKIDREWVWGEPQQIPAQSV